MNPLGINVLAATVSDRTALLAWCERAQPALVVIMDAPELAQTVKARLPASIVVHRTYNPSDVRWHEVVTPKEFLDAHLPTAGNGVALQVFNEPSGAAVFAATTWIEQLIALCPSNVALALPNFGVGNPSEDEILAGKYDRLLRAICGTRHYLALHEYFVTDPLKETPYYCGRFTFWQRRARLLGLLAPRILITEHGRDVGGGQTDGWRDTGWSEDAYFARLQQARELYCKDGIQVAVYCYGAGFSQRWQSFNVEGANALLDKMAKYEEADMPDYTTHDWGALVPKATVSVTQEINRRDKPTEEPGGKPTGVVVGKLNNGDVVGYYDKPFQNTEYLWYKIVFAGVECYAAKVSGLAFTPYTEPPPPPVEPPAEETVEFKLVEVEALIADAERIVATLKGAKLPADGTKMLLDVPFVSQRGSDADISNNDCGISSLLMLTRYAMKQRGFLVPDAPTVDDLIYLTPLKDKPVNPNDSPILMQFKDIVALAKHLGFRAESRQGMTTDAIRQSLNLGAPVMALVDYSVYNLGGAKIPHLLVVTGFDGDEFVTSDPYLLGANVRVTAAKLDAAMKTVPGNFGEYQALTLAA